MCKSWCIAPPSATSWRKPTLPAKPPRSAAKSAANHDNEGPDSGSFWPSHHDQTLLIIACVDGPRLTRVDVAFYGVRGCLRSCVRPFNAVVMTAGPDGFREPSALTTKRALCPCYDSGYPGPSVQPTLPSCSFALASSRPAAPARRRLRLCRTCRAPSRPRRSVPSCSPARRQPPAAVVAASIPGPSPWS